MKNEVTVSEQVTQFLGALAPEPKKKLRAGIRSLDSDRGDIKDLVDALTGYKPLRVGHFRVIRFLRGGRPTHINTLLQRGGCGTRTSSTTASAVYGGG